MSFFDKVRATFAPDEGALRLDGLPVVEPYAYAGQTSFSGSEFSIWDGGKFAGGFGETQIQQLDYWTLRARSAQLFNENIYARGLIRRLITNEINTGLTPEAAPDEKILGLPDDALADWTEDVESRHALWAKSPEACDWYKEDTFGAIQRNIRREAYIEGDVLIVLRFNPKTKLPAVQVIQGGSVRTPYADNTKLRAGHTIVEGVELDAQGRHAAFWVKQGDGSHKRIPAYGEKSGRRLAWLVYGTDKRAHEVRGTPLLGIILQSLKELDRYRDSVQRKAVVNSLLAMVVTKSEDRPGTLPITGAAKRRDSADVTDSTTGSTPRKFKIGSMGPGVVVDELANGEGVTMFSGQGTDINFGAFEASIAHALAWANEVPPEIYLLAFSNNYSASQAAINEFKIYINRVWTEFGDAVCQPIHAEWLISTLLLGKIQAPGLLEAWRDPEQFDTAAAWLSTDWYGSIKPSTDMLKQAKGSKMLVDEGWSTNAREARITTGTKFSKNIKRLRRENEQKAEAARPLLELQNEFGAQPADAAVQAVAERISEVIDDAA